MTPDHEAQRTCPTCGGSVEVVSSDEGTSFYRPLAPSPEAEERDTSVWRDSQGIRIRVLGEDVPYIINVTRARALYRDLRGVLAEVDDTAAADLTEAGERERLAPWIEKLDECLERDEPLREGHILGLRNDLSLLISKPEISGTDLTAALAKRMIAALWELPGFTHHEGNSVVQDIEAYRDLLRTEPSGEDIGDAEFRLSQVIDMVLDGYHDEATLGELRRLRDKLSDAVSRPTTPVEPEEKDA